jgi:hypothetical protein
VSEDIGPWRDIIFKPATKTECDVVKVGLSISGWLRKKPLRGEGYRIGIYSFVKGHPSSEIQHESHPKVRKVACLMFANTREPLGMNIPR